MTIVCMIVKLLLWPCIVGFLVLYHQSFLQDLPELLQDMVKKPATSNFECIYIAEPHITCGQNRTHDP